MLMEQSSECGTQKHDAHSMPLRKCEKERRWLDANILHLDCAADHEHDVNLFFGCWMNEHSMQIYSAKVISAFIVRIMQFCLNRISMCSQQLDGITTNQIQNLRTEIGITLLSILGVGIFMSIRRRIASWTEKVFVGFNYRGYFIQDERINEPIECLFDQKAQWDATKDGTPLDRWLERACDRISCFALTSGIPSNTPCRHDKCTYFFSPAWCGCQTQFPLYGNEINVCHARFKCDGTKLNAVEKNCEWHFLWQYIFLCTCHCLSVPAAVAARPTLVYSQCSFFCVHWNVRCRGITWRQRRMRAWNLIQSQWCYWKYENVRRLWRPWER